jgi:peptidoglycan hydrolase CwlO-like protein
MRALKFLPTILVILAILIFGLSFAQAATKEELDKQIRELQAKIAELQTQKNTLSSQIQALDGQIALSELQIQSTKQQIQDLTLDIDTTTKKIDNIEKSLDGLTKVLINRVKATYEVGSAPSLQALLISNDINDFVRRANYLKIVQAHDKRLIYDTVQAKNDYSNQKDIFEDKKEKIQALNIQLEAYNAQLENDKSSKNELLRITQNDEATYQQKLQAALAEQRAIQGIVAGKGQEISVKDVSEGTTIAQIISGASPCSTGTHLHFEVRINGSVADPKGYLSAKSTQGQQLGFWGSWPWPINDPVYITQDYGMTTWAQSGAYGGGPHTGIDMFSNGGGLSVKAVKNGRLYSGSIACGGGSLLYSKVDHGDGGQSYYLHVVTLQ